MDYAVFIGRFQPFHVGHRRVISEALSVAKKVIVLVGSAHQPRSIVNPFTYEERTQMITSSFRYRGDDRLIIRPIVDYPYDDDRWVSQVQEVVEQAIVDDISENTDNVTLHGAADRSITLIGYCKDSTSYYLKKFPMWDSVAIERPSVVDGLMVSATDIRRSLFSLDFGYAMFAIEKMLSPEVQGIIARSRSTINVLAEEYAAIEQYKQSWSSAPWPPTFVTTDAVVVQSGHVLVVERSGFPGKGQIALPGGFIGHNERLLDGCIRELKEETRIKVPVPVLRGSLVSTQVFDHPGRSTRGRTITHGFYFRLTDQTELPKVKGSDDAARAFWLQLSDLENNRSVFYEDHLSIIQTMVGI